MKNPYDVLGISKTANEEDIKKAYRDCAKKYHPDVNPNDDKAVERFKEIQEAYDLLGDPVKKSMYDGGGYAPQFRNRGRPRKAAANPPSGFSFEDVVEEFFGGSTFKGRNIQVRLEIELLEVLKGCTKYIKVKKRKRCPACTGRGFTAFTPCDHCSGIGYTQVADAPFEFRQACQVCGGTGKKNIVKCGDCAGHGQLPGYEEKSVAVHIPPGIDSGMQLRLQNEGEESVQGGRTGDVIVFVLVKAHDLFKREGVNLTVEVPVSYSQLVLGSEAEVPTLTDGVLNVKIPSGSQSHTRFRIKGKGLPNGKGTMGDLIATVKTETPKIIDEEYRKVLEQLAELEKKNLTPRREEWAKKVGKHEK